MRPSLRLCLYRNLTHFVLQFSDIYGLMMLIDNVHTSRIILLSGWVLLGWIGTVMLHEVSKIDPHAFCFDVCMLFGKIWMLSLIVCCTSAVIVAACFELSTRSSGLTHKKRDLILDWSNVSTKRSS